MSDRDISELALLGVFLVVAVSFIALTTTFRSSSAQLFPRLTSAVIVVGVILLLAERWLPKPLQRLVAEPVDIVDRDSFAEFEDETRQESGSTGTDIGVSDNTSADVGAPADDPESLADSGRRADQRRQIAFQDRLTPRQFTFAAIAGYVGGAYLLSIFVATPLFVLVYGYWNQQPQWDVGILTVISIGICLLFMSLANAPLDQSLLFPRGMF